MVMVIIERIVSNEAIIQNICSWEYDLLENQKFDEAVLENLLT